MPGSELTHLWASSATLLISVSRSRGISEFTAGTLFLQLALEHEENTGPELRTTKATQTTSFQFKQYHLAPVFSISSLYTQLHTIVIIQTTQLTWCLHTRTTYFAISWLLGQVSTASLEPWVGRSSLSNFCQIHTWNKQAEFLEHACQATRAMTSVVTSFKSQIQRNNLG